MKVTQALTENDKYTQKAVLGNYSAREVSHGGFKNCVRKKRV